MTPHADHLQQITIFQTWLLSKMSCYQPKPTTEQQKVMAISLLRVGLILLVQSGITERMICGMVDASFEHIWATLGQRPPTNDAGETIQ